MSEVSCETCRYWLKAEGRSNWAFCELSRNHVPETLARPRIIMAGKDDVIYEIKLEDTKFENKIQGILETSKDYGCIQYEHNEM